jgi:hypothetical protein
MRNRSSTGVLSSPAPYLAWELQSNLCMYSMHVHTKRDLILFFVVVIVCKNHCRGYFAAPTSHPSGRGVPIQPAVCHMYKKILSLLLICPRVTCTTLYHVPRILYHMPHTPCPIPRTSHHVSHTSYLVLCTSYSATCTSYKHFLGLVSFVGEQLGSAVYQNIASLSGLVTYIV